MILANGTVTDGFEPNTVFNNGTTPIFYNGTTLGLQIATVAAMTSPLPLLGCDLPMRQCVSTSMTSKTLLFGHQLPAGISWL